jgi:hypothetical protein
MNEKADRPPASGEPSTETGRHPYEVAIERLNMHLGGLVARGRIQAIAESVVDAIEAEARATPPALTPERLANAMAMEGYADPDPVEQWAAPVESARRILARLSASGESPEPSGEQR